jgi:transcriptional regulator GlxA family with amidase domain
MKKQIHVHLLDYPGVMKSALWGIHDLFAIANTFAVNQEFVANIVKVSEQPAMKESDSILFVPPSLSKEGDYSSEEELIACIKRWHKARSNIVATCASVFWLAEAGLLNGKMATTHWRLFDALKQAYPDIKAVDRQNMVVDEGDVMTAAGLFAFQDMVLHLVAKYSSFETAKQVADFSMLDITGRLQSYYQRFNPDYSHADTQILKAQKLCETESLASLNVSSLAGKVNLAERTFTRRFKKVLGMNPGHYLQQVRVERSKQRLDLGHLSIEQIADDIGYNDLSNFNRAFKQITGITPADYRARQQS